jgi:hypothetical protein
MCPMLLKRDGYVIGLLKLKPVARIELHNARSLKICRRVQYRRVTR